MYINIHTIYIYIYGTLVLWSYVVLMNLLYNRNVIYWHKNIFTKVYDIIECYLQML